MHDDVHGGDPENRAEVPLPARTALFGLVLAGSAFAPLLADGRSFFDVAREAFSGGILQGVLTVVALGSPFWFGLAVAAAARMPVAHLGARLVRTPIAMMHSQLILIAWSAHQGGRAVAALPLLGFAVVSALAYAVQLASARASSAGAATLRWHIRWGTMMITAIVLWAQLQRLAGVRLGWALPLALVATVLLRHAARPVRARA